MHRLRPRDQSYSCRPRRKEYTGAWRAVYEPWSKVLIKQLHRGYMGSLLRGYATKLFISVLTRAPIFVRNHDGCRCLNIARQLAYITALKMGWVEIQNKGTRITA